MFPKTPLWFQKGVKCDGDRQQSEGSGGGGGGHLLAWSPSSPRDESSLGPTEVRLGNSTVVISGRPRNRPGVQLLTPRGIRAVAGWLLLVVWTSV